MTYSSVNSITGARDQRRIERQTAPPATTVNATLGGAGVEATLRAARRATPSPATTQRVSATATKRAEPVQVKRARANVVKRERERAVREFIRQEPEEATSEVARRTFKLMERLERHGIKRAARPRKIGLTARGKAVDVKNNTLTVNRSTAAKILSPLSEPEMTRQVMTRLAAPKAPVKRAQKTLAR